MIDSRFAAILKTLETLNRFQENAVTEASKVLEINNTMRQIDQEMERCKWTIIESLKGHEATAQTLARLKDERQKIKISHEKLSDYADNARPQMIKISKARNAFLILLKDNKDDEKFNVENTQQIGKEIQKINDERLKVLDDLGRVEQSIKSLEMELNDIKTCIRLEKIENDAIYATLKQQRTNIIDIYYKLLSRYNDLAKSKKRNEEKSAIKAEKKVEYKTLLDATLYDTNDVDPNKFDPERYVIVQDMHEDVIVKAERQVLFMLGICTDVEPSKTENEMIHERLCEKFKKIERSRQQVIVRRKQLFLKKHTQSKIINNEG